METLFDLPAHALLIHAPIVLLPIAALATVALAIKPSWRVRAGWWFAGGVLSIVVMVFLARGSGQAFDEALDGAVDASVHEDLANTTFVLTLLWLASAAILVGLDRRSTHAGGARIDDAGSVSLAVIHRSFAVAMSTFAVLATIWLIRTGHEGADLVWRQTTDTVFD